MKTYTLKFFVENIAGEGYDFTEDSLYGSDLKTILGIAENAAYDFLEQNDNEFTSQKSNSLIFTKEQIKKDGMFKDVIVILTIITSLDEKFMKKLQDIILKLFNELSKKEFELLVKFKKLEIKKSFSLQHQIISKVVKNSFI